MKISLGMSLCLLGAAGVGMGVAAGCSSPSEKSETTATVQQALSPCDPTAPFNPPVAAFTGKSLADGVTFSQDGLKAYLSGKISATNSSIYVVTRASTAVPFAPPFTEVPGLDTTLSERAPSLSTGGARLYFGKLLSAGTRTNLMVSNVTAQGVVETPAPITNLNFNDLHEQDPFFLPLTSQLFYAKEPADGQRDLYVSTYSTATNPSHSNGLPLPLSKPEYDEYRPVLSSDGLTLYYSSTRAGLSTDNGGDIWTAKRTSTSVEFPTSLTQSTNLYVLNSHRVDFPVTLSNDGCTLYFASNRDTGQDFRLYQATRGTNVPAAVTTTLKIVGTGNVITAPYQCSTTCSFQNEPDSTVYLETSDQAIWSGSCLPHGGNTSSDGYLVFTNGGTCTVTFGSAPSGPGGGCVNAAGCQAGLECTLNVCRCPPGDPNCVCTPSCPTNACGALNGCGNDTCPCAPGEPCGDNTDCASGAVCCGGICGGAGCDCTASNQCATGFACDNDQCTSLPPGGCVTDADCQNPATYCDAGICLPRSCSLSDPFGSMSPVLATGISADGIAVAPGGLSAIISRKPGANYELYSVTRGSVAELFGSPVPLTSINTEGDERSPWLSMDGRRLSFHRPGSVGATDIFVAQRSSLTAPFGTPALLANVNGTANDENPFLLPGEGTVFFSSSRAPGTDLYVSNVTNGLFGPPVRLNDVVNSSTWADTHPVVRRDGLALYFQSQRSGVSNDNDGDIWLAQRTPTQAHFNAPVNLSLLNTSGIDFPVSLSADGCSLYLASNRELGLGSTQAFRLYRAQRQPSPSQVTVTVNVVGSGSVGAPFNCTSSGGTCTAQRPFGDSLIVWASSSAIWSGNCGPNGTGLSTDGVVPFNLNSTCTVTFLNGPSGAGGACISASHCQSGLECHLGFCRCPPGSPSCTCATTCSGDACGADDGCDGTCPCPTGGPCVDSSECTGGAECCDGVCGGEGCGCGAGNQCAPGLECENGACTCVPNCEGQTCEDSDGCGGTCPCDQGDPCQVDADCIGDLVCATGTCAPPECRLNPVYEGCGHAAALCGSCTKNPQCQSNADCPASLVCGVDNGWKYGLPGKRVCEDPGCAIEPEVLGCGLPTSPCGFCPRCEPNCAGKACGDSELDDGCGGLCAGLCPDGDPAGCASNADCEVGSVCLPVDLQCDVSVCARTCRPSDPCAMPGLAAPACGSAGAVCGPSCPPQIQGEGTCRDRLCGTDPVDGQSCGNCPANAQCGESGRCIPVLEVDTIEVPDGPEPNPAMRPVIPAQSPSGVPVGALAGHFAVSDRGSATYTIPIEVPPGVAGLAPSLAFSYSSGTANGALGLGWSIAGISMITSCNRTYLLDGRSAPPLTYDPGTDDPYCLDGERLLEKQTAAGIILNTATDSFLKIVPITGGDSGIVGFTVHTRDGQVLTYGGYTSTALARATLATTTFTTYALSRVADRAGNFIQFTYEQVPARDGSSMVTAEVVPSAIIYTGHTSGGVDKDGDREILFKYHDEIRGDYALGFRPGGAPLQRTKLLRAVEVRAQGNLVRRYELTHELANRQNVLTAIQEAVTELPCSASTSLCKPATSFRYYGHSGTTPSEHEIDNGIGFHPGQIIPAPLTGDALARPFGLAYAWGAQDGWGTRAHMVTAEDEQERRGDRIATKWGRRTVEMPSPVPGYVGLGLSVGALVSDSTPLTWTALGYTILTEGFNLVFGESEVTSMVIGFNFSPAYRDEPELLASYVLESTPAREIVVDPRGGESVNIYSRTRRQWLIDVDGDGVQDRLRCRMTLGTVSSSIDYQLANARTLPTGVHPLPPVEMAAADITGTIGSYSPGLCQLPVSFGATTLSVPDMVFDVDGDGTPNLIVRDDALGWAALDFSTDPDAPQWRTDWFAALRGLISIRDHFIIPADTNGDGLRDIVALSGRAATPSYIAINTGRGFDPRPLTSATGEDALRPPKFLYFITDIDHDGREEILEVNGNNRDLRVSRPWTVRTIYNSTIYQLDAANHFGPSAGHFNMPPGGTGDFDGDGNIDIATLGPDNNSLMLYRGKGRTAGLLQAVTDGLGRRVEVKYDNTYNDFDGNGNKLVFESGFGQVSGFDPTCRWPYRCGERLGEAVVSSHEESHYLENAWENEQTDRRFSYSYRGWREGITPGQGSPGFWNRRIVTRDGVGTVLNDTTISFQPPAHWSPISSTIPHADPLAGLVRQVVSVGRATFNQFTSPSTQEVLVSEAVNVWERHISARGLPFAFLAEQTENVFLRGAPPDADELLFGRSTTYTPDEYGYGNVTHALTTSTDYVDNAPVPGSETIVEVTTPIEPPDVDSWLISQVASETVVATPRCSAPAECESLKRTRHTRFIYYPSTGSDPRAGLLQYVMRDPGDLQAHLVTEFFREDTSGNPNPYGNVTGILSMDLSGAQRRTNIAYDARGLFPETITRIGEGQSHTTQVRFDERFGTLTAAADPNGIDETHSYDEFGVERHSRGPGGVREVTYVPTNAFEWNGFAMASRYRVAVTNGDGSQMEVELDPFGKPVRRVTMGFNAGVVEEFGYDAFQQLSVRSRPHIADDNTQGVITYQYDGIGRVTSVDYPGAGRDDLVKYEYGLMRSVGDQPTWNAAGGLFAVRTSVKTGTGSPLHQVAITNRDGQMVRLLDGLNQPTNYLFAAFGDVRRITDPAGRSIDVVHDDWSRVTSVMDQARGGAETNQYNGFDELKVALNPAFRQVFVYDDFGRLERVTDTDLITQVAEDTTWHYDGDGSRPNELGRLVSTLSPTGQQTTFRYEPPVTGRNRGFNNQVIEHLVAPGSPSSSRDLTTDYIFQDDRPLLERVDYPGAFGTRASAVYEYEFGDLVAVRDGNIGTPAHWLLCEAEQGYRVNRERFRASDCDVPVSNPLSGIETRRSFDQLTGEMTGIETRRTGSPRQALGYGYDLAGRLTHREALSGVPEDFGYDALSRLTHVNNVERYHYDSSGNGRLEWHEAELGRKDYAYQPQGRDWIASAGTHSYTQDAVGNVKTRTAGSTTQVFDYTAFDLPRKITAGANVTEIAYDAGGVRAVKRSPVGTTFYAGDHHQEIEEPGGAGRARSMIYAGGRAIAQIDTDSSGTATTRYLFGDHLGSPETITSADGTVESVNNYSPFGEQRSGTGNPPGIPTGFTGHELDPELDLVNMKGRLYDPYLGQFLQADPIISMPYSQGLNRYAYVDNSPLNFTDPSGFSKGWKADYEDCWWDGPACRFSVLPSFGSNTEWGAFQDIALWTVGVPSVAGGIAAGVAMLALIPGPGGVGGPGGDQPGGGSVNWGAAARRGANIANVVHHGRKVFGAPSRSTTTGIPPVPGSGARATGGQGAPTKVRPNAAAPGKLELPHLPKDTSGWLAGDGAGGPGTPYLQDPARKPPGWSEEWPEGVDDRGPYSEDPSGNRWYPHPEDNRHWDHYDGPKKGDRYPERSVKARPEQKRLYRGQGRTDPWKGPSVPKPLRLTVPRIPQEAVNGAAAGAAAGGAMFILGVGLILLLPLGL